MKSKKEIDTIDCKALVRAVVFIGKKNNCDVSVDETSNPIEITWKKKDNKSVFKIYSFVTKEESIKILNRANRMIDIIYGEE